jgi:hypothetical protein
MAPGLRERIIQIKENIFQKREIPTFGFKDILKDKDGKYRLHIKLGETGFQLPLVHLDIPYPNEAALGWFDPSPEKNPQIDEASTEAMFGMLKKMKPKVVVMTNSIKSEHFIKEAVKKLPPGTKLILLPSGNDENEVKNRSLKDASLTDYVPVTHTQKWMGYPKEKEGQVDYISLEELKKLCPNGKGLVIADDVYTTGATSRAMEKVLGLNGKSKHKIAVIAIEKRFNGEYEKKILPRNITGAFYLAEFIELTKLGIDRSKLYKYDKPRILPAIVENEQQK